MDSVVTSCSQCNHCLAVLLNLWTQIGKSYISPAIQTDDAFDIRTAGTIRQGEKGTIVDSCHVQEIVCAKCSSTLGSKCVSSTVNHVLYEGQLLLRTSSIQIKDPNHNIIKRPSIQRVLKLKNKPIERVQRSDDEFEDDDQGFSIAEDHSHGQTRQNKHSPGLSHILGNIHAQREEIERLDKAGYQIVASFNQAVQRIDEDVRNLKREMAQITEDSSDNNTKAEALVNEASSMKKDINDMKKTLQLSISSSHLEQETQSIRKAISKTSESLHLEFSNTLESHHEKIGLLESNLDSARRDMKELKKLLEDSRAAAKVASSAANAGAEEIAGLKTELQQIKEELAVERSQQSHAVNPVFDPQDMDILTNSITKIGDRASQVETLRMEFDLLKSRVQRIETQPLTSKTDTTSNPQRRESLGFRSVRAKRKASSISAMPAIPSDVEDDHITWSSSPTGRIRDSSPPPSAEPSGKVANTRPQRLAKSGTVNKQTPASKRGSRQGATGPRAKRL
ncbi:hypothetical protein F4861DRAFT_10925 [Xylaria intraflava]|nr:hypothetical protein F4861DRAFT_10925 [Xylaria intraflava]